METVYQLENATSDYIGAIARYNSEMALETEKKFLKSEIVLEATKKVVEDPQFGFSIVAIRGEQLASFLNGCFFFDATSDCLVSFINSVYVTKEHRKKGLFNKMFDGLIEKSQMEGAKAIRLYVDTENLSAKKVYIAIGMRQIDVELFNVDLLSNSVADIEFRSIYYELLDECEFSLSPASRQELESLNFENLSSVLHSNRDANKAKKGALGSFSSKYSAQAYLLKQNGSVVGFLSGYHFNCDWTDCKMSCINDICIEGSVIEDAQEITALMLQLFIDQDDYPNRHVTIMVKDAREWVKPLLRTCGATLSNYNIFEKLLL